MRRFRSTLKGLLGVVLFVAVALAALRDPTDAWESGVLGLSLLILLTGTLLAVHGSDRRRAGWVGFALFGWVYLIVSLVVPIGARLPTSRGLFYVGSKLANRGTPASATYQQLIPWNPGLFGSPQPLVPDLTLWSPTGPNTWVDWNYTWQFTGVAPPGFGIVPENFVRIGHSLLALVLALVGSHLSRWLYDRNHVGLAGGGDHPSDDRRRP